MELTASLSAAPTSMQLPLCLEQDILRNRFNKEPFAFTHFLTGHPALTMENLSSVLKRRMAADRVYWNAGDKKIEQRMDEDRGIDFSIEDAMTQIEKTKSWILMMDVQYEPEFKDLLDIVTAQIAAELGPGFLRSIKNRISNIFVTSPQRVTPFHIDCECSFLLQIRGPKTIHLFSPRDRDMVREEEVERFWAGDNYAAKYRPEYQDHAFTCTMVPGTGVHIPVNAGHWLQNGEETSISIGFYYQFHNHIRANVYRVNHYMRKLGLHPAPPGQNAWCDTLKGRGLEPAITAARAIMPWKTRERYK